MVTDIDGCPLNLLQNDLLQVPSFRPEKSHRPENQDFSLSLEMTT
jgi:hypothetical protein